MATENACLYFGITDLFLCIRHQQ